MERYSLETGSSGGCLPQHRRLSSIPEFALPWGRPDCETGTNTAVKDGNERIAPLTAASARSSRLTLPSGEKELLVLTARVTIGGGPPMEYHKGRYEAPRMV